MATVLVDLISKKTGFLRSLEKLGQKFGHFQPGKVGKKTLFGLLVWKNKIIFQT